MPQDQEQSSALAMSQGQNVSAAPHDVLLPVLEQVSWAGFEYDKEAEADVFQEDQAMQRLGWTENLAKVWLTLLSKELQTRDNWWHFLQQYANERWNGDIRGSSDVQADLRKMFFLEEHVRRLDWNLHMRHMGFGQPAKQWWCSYKKNYRWWLPREWTYPDSASECDDDDDDNQEVAPGRGNDDNDDDDDDGIGAGSGTSGTSGKDK